MRPFLNRNMMDVFSALTNTWTCPGPVPQLSIPLHWALACLLTPPGASCRWGERWQQSISSTSAKYKNMIQYTVTSSMLLPCNQQLRMSNPGKLEGDNLNMVYVAFQMMLSRRCIVHNSMLPLSRSVHLLYSYFLDYLLAHCIIKL